MDAQAPDIAPSPRIAALVDELSGPNGPQSRFDVEERRVEHDAIVELLVRGRSPGIDHETAERVAGVVAAGCLGEMHLWRDMGLPDRVTLRELLETYFGPFASENVMDMRWKKFIYRKLCRWGGFNTCKAPSCSVCPEYHACFGEGGFTD